MRGCSAWQFQEGLCRAHARQEADPLTRSLAQLYTRYNGQPPLRPNLIVFKQSVNPSHVRLADGEIVHVMDLCSDNETVVIQTQAKELGYYAVACLATEEEVYELWKKENAREIEEHDRLSREEEKRRELEYEEYMRKEMIRKAREDEEKRARLAAQRQREAEERQRQLELQRMQEELEAMKKAEERKKKEEEMARLREEMYRLNLEEARRLREESDSTFAQEQARKAEERRIWEAEQARKKDEAFLATLPPWKKDLVLRKRAQSQHGHAKK